MKAATKLLITSLPLTCGLSICPIVDKFAGEVADSMGTFEDDELTEQEIADGYFIDSVLGRCNIKKAMAERAEAIRREYEAFDNMHLNDGTFTTERFSRL